MGMTRILLPLALLLAGCAAHAPLGTAHGVDLVRYAGRWHEIARFPKFYEKGCVASVAEYTPTSEGTLRVVNRCREGAIDGPERSVRGTATVVDPVDHARLKVSFGPGREGDYWILDVTDDYHNALVGTPDRDSLWILGRSTRIEQTVLDRFTAVARERGFDVSRLVFTPQPPPESPDFSSTHPSIRVP